MRTATDKQEQVACSLNDLIPYSGIALLLGDRQIALFYLPDEQPSLYAIDNYDPIGKANVMSRGIVGDKDGEPVVASPLYKQHFSLRSGKCLEDDSVCLQTWSTAVINNDVVITL